MCVQEKKKSKKNKKEKKDKRDKDRERHSSSKHVDKSKQATAASSSSSAPAASTARGNSRKESIDSADEEGQVVVGSGEEGSPATKRPRVEGGEKGSGASSKVAENGAAHKVEENGNGSAAVPL